MTKFNLPFKDTKVWNYLSGNSYLSVKYKLLYIATPKVACTSLKWWFAALEGYSKILSEVADSVESDPDLVIHDSFHKVAPNVTGLTPDVLAEPIASDSYFRFAVVRNPYKRLFSAWQSKLLLREPLQVGPYLKYDFIWMPIESAADIALAFESFLEHLASHEAPNYKDIHWTPQVTLLRPDLISYTKLTQIENAKELSYALAKHLGQNISDPFADYRTNESLIPYLPDFITDRAAALIRSLYEEDFNAFGYNSQLPDAKEEFSSSQLNVALRAIRLIRGRHQRLAQVRSVLSEQIANLNQVVTECNAHIAYQDKELVAYRVQAEEYSRQVKRLQAELELAQAHIAHQDKELAAYRVQAEEYSRQVKRLQAELELAQAHIAHQDKELVTYRVQAKEYSRKLGMLQEQRAFELSEARFLSKQLMRLLYNKFARLFRGGVR